MDSNKINNRENTSKDSVFLLRVQFRRNTSWQGILQSMNSRKSCIFRSVLELGYLIHNEHLANLGVDNNQVSKLPTWGAKEDVS